ncbi:MAG: single-stranded-DNA-specific exonuclease RecJ [Gammaproteobacteria bacterium]|jgi:single-stranded-DNA-specific exonuclease|nr:single-stranded-DNA-specific exonuclease RecJ [Gammaproteobacteria bacterium]
MPLSSSASKSSLTEQPPVRILRKSSDSGAPLTSVEALLRCVYANRGVNGVATAGLGELHPVDALHGIDDAAALIADQVEHGGRFVVVGDFDADGATGTAVALLGLRGLGATGVDFLVPSRFAHGYGLSPAVVEAAAERKPDLLITVDNGIASHAGIERATALGIPVLVTDHHLPGAELPAAIAILNPNQPACGFPSKHLAGVGVVFYLLVAVRAELRRRGWFQGGRTEPNLAELLDLVALGTVADVVTLDENNRILVEQGLRRIRAGRCRPGLRALLEIAGVVLERTTARDLGFAAGPRLNAAGRLEDMSAGIECLIADEPVKAMRLAQRLNDLNRERRALTAEMGAEAERLIERLGANLGTLPAGLCLFAEDWHQGVVGIVAARVRERWNRPVIAFADGGDGLLKGSARSVEGLNVRDCIDAVDKRCPGLIERFGGHAMAAGLSLQRDALAPFQLAFADEVAQALGDAPATRELLSDGELAGPLLSLPTAEALRVAAPWGKGFSEPLFDGVFELSAVRVIKDRHLKLRARTAASPPLEAIGFGLAELRGQAGGHAHLAYRLAVNEYRGLRMPQLLIEHLARAPSAG